MMISLRHLMVWRMHWITWMPVSIPLFLCFWEYHPQRALIFLKTSCKKFCVPFHRYFRSHSPRTAAKGRAELQPLCSFSVPLGNIPGEKSTSWSLDSLNEHLGKTDTHRWSLAFLNPFYLTLFKMDISFRRTISADPSGVHVSSESWPYS